jgi:hypothetical protein
MMCGSTYTLSAARWNPRSVSVSITASGRSGVLIIRSTTTYSCVAVGYPTSTLNMKRSSCASGSG